MAEYTFTTTAGQTVARELLLAYLNTGTSTAPVWSVIGKRVEDSSEEYDWSTESKKDILGNTYGTMKKPVITQSFEPCELDSGDTAQQKIWKMAVVDQDAMALAAQDMLIVHTYAGFAERYEACMVEVTGLGGEGGGSVGMPITVTYGGKRTIGSAAKKSDGSIEFTAATV
jgi:hypothetical protein